MSRREEISANLGVVRERIAAAERAAGRPEGDVSLVVVTKYFPATDVEILADLGVRDVGENRHQEAEAKAAATAGLDLRWHYIGGLQSNKAAAVAGYADVVESVDRAKLLAPLERGRAARLEGGGQASPLDVLLQVSLDAADADHRAGVAPEQLAGLAEAVADHPSLRLAGLMAVAPLGEDPAVAFARLAEMRDGFLRDHPQARTLSAGMSGDLEEAVAIGATHVRVGSAILGGREVIK